MAITKHAYYASFGYQVTAFFAASSRYGIRNTGQLDVNAENPYFLVFFTLFYFTSTPFSIFIQSINFLSAQFLCHARRCLFACFENVCDGLNQFDGSNATFMMVRVASILCGILVCSIIRRLR